MSCEHTIPSVGLGASDASDRWPRSPRLTRRRHVDMMWVCSAACPRGARR